MIGQFYTATGELLGNISGGSDDSSLLFTTYTATGELLSSIGGCGDDNNRHCSL